MFNAKPTDKQIQSWPLIQLWLFFICLLIFIMVIIGGATRLTGSGLSITEWKPIMGTIPPLNTEQWLEAFEKYKQIPQYKEINIGMSLAEFKSIFWWEWAHRFFGRFIGIAFFIPFIGFLITKRIVPNLQPKLWILFLLGGLQGALGWYMVASGLVDRVDVSQYRLAAHLGLAIFIFAVIYWVALGLKPNTRKLEVTNYMRWCAQLIIALIFLQILAGAFVAGLKAGLSHNTWPLMDGKWIPDGLGVMAPWWKNIFENVLTVQFDHRILAYLIVIAIAAHLWSVFKSENAPAKLSGGLLFSLTLIQISLGIYTLLYQVPIIPSLLHQGGAVILLTAALWHLHRLTRTANAKV